MKFRFCSGKDVPEWLLAEVSVLSRISCVRLKLITRQVVNELAGDGALDVDKVQKIVPKGQGFAWSDVKAALAAIAYILEQAARSDVDHAVLGAELQQLGLPKENSDGISRPFRIHGARLRAQARADSLRAPALLSLDWRLDAVLATSRLGVLRAQPAAPAPASALAAAADAVDAAAPASVAVEPVLHLRLGLSHAADALPQRISARDLGTSRLLLAARAKAGGAGSPADAAADEHAASRPVPVPQEYCAVSLSSTQAAVLLAELKIARAVLKSVVDATAGARQ